MCGSCGSAPARHWSAPFLAVLPARSSAARAVTVIAAQAGARVQVAAAAGGYTVTTPTGVWEVAADLGQVWARLRQRHALGPVLPVPPMRIASAGPATVPSVHPRVLADTSDRRTANAGTTLAVPGLWLHRFPTVLAWLAAVDGCGPRGLRLGLRLTAQVDAAVDVFDGIVVRCAAVPGAESTDGLIELDDRDGSFAVPLAMLLGLPAASALATQHPQPDPVLGLNEAHYPGADAAPDNAMSVEQLDVVEHLPATSCANTAVRPLTADPGASAAGCPHQLHG
jgi:hypothetical protein